MKLRILKLRMRKIFFVIMVLGSLTSQAQMLEYDVILRHGTIYDGSGGRAYVGDVAIQADTLAAIGDLASAKGKTEIDCTAMAISPGFINMLSWADGTLLQDGRGVSDIKQGVTLEVFGEGISAGPRQRKPGDKLWTTLGGYFDCARCHSRP